MRNTFLHVSWKFQVKILKNSACLEKKILRLSQTEIWGKFSFLQFFRICIQISTNFQLKITKNINLVTFKNIDIWQFYGPNTIIFCAYAQIWAYDFWRRIYWKSACVGFWLIVNPSPFGADVSFTDAPLALIIVKTNSNSIVASICIDTRYFILDMTRHPWRISF